MTTVGQIISISSFLSNSYETPVFHFLYNLFIRNSGKYFLLKIIHLEFYFIQKHLNNGNRVYIKKFQTYGAIKQKALPSQRHPFPSNNLKDFPLPPPRAIGSAERGGHFSETPRSLQRSHYSKEYHKEPKLRQ